MKITKIIFNAIFILLLSFDPIVLLEKKAFSRRNTQNDTYLSDEHYTITTREFLHECKNHPKLKALIQKLILDNNLFGGMCKNYFENCFFDHDKNDAYSHSVYAKQEHSDDCEPYLRASFCLNVNHYDSKCPVRSINATIQQFEQILCKNFRGCQQYYPADKPKPTTSVPEYQTDSPENNEKNLLYLIVFILFIIILLLIIIMIAIMKRKLYQSVKNNFT